MLADYDDSIDGQLAGAEGQGFRDGGVKLHGGMAVETLLGQVALAAPVASLIDVERYHVHRRMVERAGPSIAVEEAVYDVLAVQ
jgi:hypothetical protein